MNWRSILVTMLLTGGILGLPAAHAGQCAISISEADDQKESAVAKYGELGQLETYKNRDCRSGHIDMGGLGRAMDRYFDWKERLLEDTGFNYMLEISPQYQWEMGHSSNNTGNNEANMIFQWAMFDRSDFQRGGIMAWIQQANTFGSTTHEFQQDLGALTPVNGGDTFPAQSRTALMLLAWEQWFLEDTIRFDIGKLTTRVLLDLNRYAVSDREDFFSPIIVNNIVVPYTARITPGAFVQYKQPTWYVSTMIRNADGTSQWLDFSNLNSGNWEYAMEIAFTPQNFLGLGQGYYRFIPYFTDSIGEGATAQPAGWTWSLSFDQDLGGRLGAAFRYANAQKPFRALRQSASLSLQIKQPFGFENDRIGFGIFWGKPSDQKLDSETGAELYWKMQISPAIEFTPGVQVHFDPSLHSDSGRALIGELRLRVVL